MTLRMDAGLRSKSELRASAREPTGWPSRMYHSTRVLSNCCARSLSSGELTSSHQHSFRLLKLGSLFKRVPTLQAVPTDVKERLRAGVVVGVWLCACFCCGFFVVGFVFL